MRKTGFNIIPNLGIMSAPIYKSGEQLMQIVGFNMNFFGNAGFTNTLLIFAFFSIVFGIFRSLFHNK